MTELMQGYLNLTHLKLLSVQGLLHDDLQEDLGPCYSRRVCGLFVVDERYYCTIIGCVGFWGECKCE